MTRAGAFPWRACRSSGRSSGNLEDEDTGGGMGCLNPDDEGPAADAGLLTVEDEGRGGGR
jgi:hypothetical protein